MTRPGIIRADTIDLQDQTSPSAKDHTRQPSHPSALGAGPAAPHQAETLREVAAETEEEESKSPRVSYDWPNGGESTGAGNGRGGSLTGANLQQQDSRNGGGSGSTTEDSDMADGEGDDMDDDMMDKISSSPSIDDGGCSLSEARIWPSRVDSLIQLPTPQFLSLSKHDSSERSLSPIMEDTVYYPLLSEQLVDSGPTTQDLHHHHLHNTEGEYRRLDDSMMSELDQMLGELDEILPTAPLHRANLGLPQELELPLLEPLNESILDSDDTVDEAELAEIEAQIARMKAILKQEETEEDEGVDLDDYEDYDDDQLTIPYESSDEDDDDERPFPTDSRFIDSGWGGECLQDLEDIDFEFVYALHTFVATVEGQANATKGDTMVLLDDSNSYWWLVRVVKDSSIGYLPAEHIETPTERLARLNKHRNIDLSAAMLGDQNDKPKNPLKKAIRRRNAKTVQFAAPTYVEASDYDYSTDEEEAEAEAAFYAQQQKSTASQKTVHEDDEIATVEPLSVKSQKAATADQKGESKLDEDDTRDSDEMFEGRSERQTRNGTVRNTDSFFKDDTVETKKITITPNILRDDSSTSTRASNESSKEVRQRPSLERLDKEVVVDKSKDDKKKKDKKPGMLSGLFKRKDKKSKNQEDDLDELIYGKDGKKSIDDTSISPVPSKDSEDSGRPDEPTVAAGPAPQRNPSKLQKHPRTDAVPVKSALVKTIQEPEVEESEQIAAPQRAAPTLSAAQSSMRLVPAEVPANVAPVEEVKAPSPDLTREVTEQQAPPEEPQSRGLMSKLRARSNSEAKEPKPEKVKKAKARMEMDDFDSSTDTSPGEEIQDDPMNQAAPQNKLLQRPIPGAFPDSFQSTAPVSEPTHVTNNARERLSESPVHVSPVDNSRSENPPPLMVDNSSQEEHPSPVSSPSPEPVNADESQEKKDNLRSFSTSASTPTWSDAHLRTFFDDDSDIKDLLVVVYDKSGVIPAGPDHPIVGSLFKEENAKLAEITSRLDGMLGDWLARKSKATAIR